MFDIGIISAPRRPHYLGLTLDSIFDIWPTAKVSVFEEPGIGYYYNQSRCIRHHNERVLGCVENWHKALTKMIDNTTNPFVMMCEDDIELSVDVREKIDSINTIYFGVKPNAFRDRFPLTRVGFFSFYTSLANDVAKAGPGWFQPYTKKAGWCGALCLLLPVSSAILIRDSLDAFLALASKYATYPKHLDYAIGQLLLDNNLVLFAHKPTLVTHIGEVSTFETLSDKYNYAREPLL